VGLRTGPSYEKYRDTPLLEAVPTVPATVRATPRLVPDPLFTLQRKLVPVSHDDDAQVVAPSCAKADGSAVLKFRPSIETTEVPPTRGAFALRMVLTAGASYENEPTSVPTMPETSTRTEVAADPTEATKATVVSLVHDAVRLAVVPTVTVTDRSRVPKFIPLTVNDPPEVEGALVAPDVMMAESNVKLLSRHPMLSERVTAT